MPPSSFLSKPKGDAPAAHLVGDLAAAVVVALAAIAFYVSAATLLFQGELAAHLPAAIGAALFGGTALAAIGAWRGALPLASTGPEPATVPVLAAITAGVAASVHGPALLPTAVMALTVTGLLVGALWWVAGRRGWGELMRYIPYPVIGGFLGSIGWLMLTGGMGVSMGASFSPARALAWLQGGADWRLATGLALGVLIWRATLRFTHPLTLPAVIALGAFGVHAGLAAAGIGLDAARDSGWLLTAFSRTQPALPWSPALLAEVRWDAIAAQLPLIVSAVIVATIGLLLSDTSLEVAWDADADINQDLRTLGQGNLATCALGGLVGGISISRSLLNKAAGAQTRRSGYFKAALCLFALLGGGPLIALVPRPLLGGVLVYLGLGMLKTWLLDSRRKLPRQEYAIVAAMVLITAAIGFLAAVCVGVLACCVDFAAKSARLAPVRRLLPRSAWPVKAERGAAQTALLQREGERLRIVELQGVLFFGSTSQLARQIDPLLGGGSAGDCLLFDFKHVRWLDTSAGQSVARLFKAARRRGWRVELSGVAPPARGTLQGSGVLDGATREHADIDAAVDAWDSAVLAREPSSTDAAARADWVPAGLSREWLDVNFEPLRLASGAPLFAQGDASDALYLVRSGCVAISAPGESGPVLLRTVHAGSAIGEMGFLRELPRSAAAAAVGETELLVLTRERFDRLVRTQPDFEAALYRVFLTQMAGRVEQLGMQANRLAR